MKPTQTMIETLTLKFGKEMVEAAIKDFEVCYSFAGMENIMPPEMIDKVFKNWNKDLFTVALETVEMFDKDARESGYRI